VMRTVPGAGAARRISSFDLLHRRALADQCVDRTAGANVPLQEVT
jgi:hypothetical protein